MILVSFFFKFYALHYFRDEIQEECILYIVMVNGFYMKDPMKTEKSTGPKLHIRYGLPSKIDQFVIKNCNQLSH